MTFSDKAFQKLRTLWHVSFLFIKVILAVLKLILELKQSIKRRVRDLLGLTFYLEFNVSHVQPVSIM